MLTFVIISSPLSIPHCCNCINLVCREMWEEEEKAIG